jgi:hypothetical protein
MNRFELQEPFNDRAEKSGRLPDGNFFTYSLKQMTNALDPVRDRLSNLADAGYAPHIVNIEGVDGYPLYSKIIMKYAPGVLLEEFVQQNPEQAHSNEMAKKVADLFIAMEQAGVGHIDYGPHNIIYDTDRDQCVVIDFETMIPIETRPSFTIFSGADTIFSMHFGQTFTQIFEEMEELGQLQSLIPNSYEEFVKLFEENPYNIRAFFYFAEEFITNLYQSQCPNVDPDLVQFVIDAIQPDTQIRDFSRVYALK